MFMNLFSCYDLYVPCSSWKGVLLWPTWWVLSGCVGLSLFLVLNVGDSVAKSRLCWGVEQLISTLIKTSPEAEAGFEGIRHMIGTLGLTVFFLSAGGLVPGVASWMGQIFPPLFLAYVHWGMMVVLSISRGGLFKFLSTFVPEAAPRSMAFTFCSLEMVSMIFRPITMMTRVIVNVVAGHLLICVSGGLVLLSLSFVGWVGVAVKMVALLLMVGVLYYEVFVCATQGCVFAMLAGIYAGEAMDIRREEKG